MVEFNELKSKKEKICVVGLGYVGLPLAFLLSKKFSVLGLDINKDKIRELKNGIDKIGEIKKEKFNDHSIEFTDNPADIGRAMFIILAIPTPIDKNKRPDLDLLIKASRKVGQHIKQGSVVVFESTVYPGATEEVCLPILESESGLKSGPDFKVGYSPERVNPGDKEHAIEKITKIVSGMDKESLDLIDKVYLSVITAGTFRASSIKVAEAAKVIENTQRDLNIALINELAVIFHKIHINTYEVLDAAATKWNFIKFIPGLVGGHCIGVDSYYLTYKAESLGYHPEVILAGRRINDSMGQYITLQILKIMAGMNKSASDSRVAILGFTFKENVSDFRNSKVADLFQELRQFGLAPLVYDPLADKEEVKSEYGIELCNWDDLKNIDTLILAVPHKEFLKLKLEDYRKLMNKEKSLIVDIKHIFNKEEVRKAGIEYWSL